MNWIFDHFQIVLLIALALGSWAKRRMDVKRAAQEQARGELAGDGDVSGSDEGWPQPQRQAPPPIVRQHPSPPRPPSVPPPMAVELYDTAAQLRRQQDLQERLRQIRATRTPATGGVTKATATGGVTKATTTGGAAATRSRVSATQRHVNPVPHAKSGLLGSLHSRKEIRRAILMREILGPPVGLR